MSNQKKRNQWIAISIIIIFLLLLIFKEIPNKINHVIKDSFISNNEEFTNAADISNRKNDVFAEDKSKELYYDFLKNKEYQKDFYFPQQVRYELVYLDEDDVLELLLAEGNAHGDRIEVYYYDFETKEVTFLASFSSFGRMSYIPKKNTIISSYGNHGYYHSVYSGVTKGKVYLKELFLEVGTLKETAYYYDIPVQEGITGGFQTATEETDYVMNIFPAADEMYRITEEEYWQRMEKSKLGAVTISYDKMKEIE